MRYERQDATGLHSAMQSVMIRPPMDIADPKNTPARRVRKTRTPSLAERDLWRHAVAGVKPLGRPDGRNKAPEPASPEAVSRGDSVQSSPQPNRSRAGQPAPPLSEPAPNDLIHGTASGIDKRTLARLRRGMIAPDVRVDLHNLRQDEAHRLLSGILASSHATGRRCVLVITGKGYGADGSVGVLKRMVPRWLVEPPNRGRVLAFCHAARSHGGEGALYVLLRRSRNDAG